MANYIDAKEFSLKIKEYNDECERKAGEGLTPGKVPDSIARLFLLLATNIAKRKEFNGYAFKEDLIQEGALSCVKCIQNYDYSKGFSAYSYFTQVIYWRFVQVIKKEYKQTNIKSKILEGFMFDDHVINDDEISSNGRYDLNSIENHILSNNYYTTNKS